MKTVIYTDDLQPINVIDLPIEVWNEAVKTGALRLAIKGTQEHCLLLALPVITVEGRMRHLLVTPHEEQALKLNPEWLPGQQAAVNFIKATIKKLTNKLRGLEEG